jgi:hypothetical protein
MQAVRRRNCVLQSCARVDGKSADSQITLQIAEGFLDLGQLKQAAGLPTTPGN